MNKLDASKKSKRYLIIVVTIITIIMLIILYFDTEFKSAYIPDELLDNGWGEDIDKRNSGSQLIGLNKWSSFTYTIDNSYPSYLTISTIKTLLILSEEDLKEKINSTIKGTVEDNISINNAFHKGERTLKNGHKTLFIVYNGNITSKNPPEKIKIIGEIWNCEKSGTSIISLGVAQITDNKHNNSEINYKNWKKIINDQEGTFGSNFINVDGLIYNIICH